MNFNEVFGKNVTYDDIKSDRKTKLGTLLRQHIFETLRHVFYLGLRHVFFS